MSLAQKALVGAGASWVASLGSFAARFAANAVLLRMIAPTAFGDFALALVYTELLAIIVTPTFAQAILQFPEPADEVLPTVLSLNTWSAIILVALSVLSWPLIAHFDSASVAQLVPPLALSRALPSIVCTYDNLLQRDLEFTRIAKLRLAGVVTSVLAALALAIAGWPLVALLARELLPNCWSAVGFVRVVVPRVLASQRPPEARRAMRARVFQLGKGIFSMRALEVAYQRIDQLVLARWLGTRELAIYSQGRYVAGLPHAAVAGAAHGVAMQILVQVQSDHDKFRRTNELLQLVSAHVSMMFAILFCFAPRAIVGLAFGEKWAELAPVLPFLAPWVAVFPASQNAQTVLLVLQMWRELRATQLLQLAVLAVATPSLIVLMGVQGAALSLLFPLLAGMLWMRRAVPSELRARTSTFRGVFAGTVVTAALWLIVKSPPTPLYELAFAAVAVVIYGVAAVLGDVRRAADLANQLRTALRKRRAPARGVAEALPDDPAA